MQVFPTPESPIRSSLKSRSYVNGKQLGNTYGLLSTVCKEYAGDAPIGCKSLLSPKRTSLSCSSGDTESSFLFFVRQ